MVISGLFLIVAGAFITYIGTRPQHVVPTDIQQRLSFSPFVISPSSHIGRAADYKLNKTETGVQTLVYRLTVSDADVTVTQSVQPSQFVDIPNYKDQFLSNVFNQYATVQTANGVIYLGRADKLRNHQFGVMLEKGLLIFLNPTKELSDQTWRSIGNSLLVENMDT